MEIEEIISKIRRIIDIEATGNSANLREVEEISLILAKCISGSDLKELGWNIYHFIDDFDVRAKDSSYKARQTAMVLRELDKLEKRVQKRPNSGRSLDDE